ncbi:hypothetical protein [Streptosporangium saharense]|uniref:hypothetical protein n=1 Tax=Streptosporangium saharense TaxID=1706840 RepID=UPI00344AAB12
MSRHKVPTENPATTFAVGWDTPLATYFAQHFTEPADLDDDPEELFWLGGTPCELPTTEDLTAALAQYGAALPAGLLQQLDADRLAEGAHFNGRPATVLIAAAALDAANPGQADRIREQLRGAL